MGLDRLKQHGTLDNKCLGGFEECKKERCSGNKSVMDESLPKSNI